MVPHTPVARHQRSLTPPSDIEASPSPVPHCLCGVAIRGDAIYCSIACARGDAFSSLCFKEASTSHSRLSSLDRSLSPQSSHHSYLSSMSSQTNSYRESSVSDCPSDAESAADWNASHYRRMAREEQRRDERRAERRRRRADAAPSASRVPDLVGGNGYHSRNSSTATTSSVATYSSRGSSYLLESSLSRNPSTTSNKRLAPGFSHAFQEIREDDDEQEWLDSASAAQPIHVPARRKRSHSNSKPKLAKAAIEPATFGMGKDMRDVLDDILRMEQGFVVEDAQVGLDMPFVKSFAGRMPRTPSPGPSSAGSGLKARRNSARALEPPPAPQRATHRPSRSQQIELSSPSHPLANAPRPPSYQGLGHQTSLSESHTLLLQLSAEPDARRSLSFTPTSAYPAFLAAARPSPTLTVTPPRRYRRPANPTPPSPTVHHPAMGHWRFPAQAQAQAQAQALESNTATPTKAVRERAYGHEREPSALLWPPPNLQPSLFPQSPAGAGDTPSAPMQRPHSATLDPSPCPGPFGHQAGFNPSHLALSPPRSGLRLGVLCGSGNGSGEGSDDDMDLDMDDDVNEGMEGIGRAMGFLPVYAGEDGEW